MRVIRTLRVGILVTESLVMPNDAPVELRIYDLTRNPGIIIIRILEQNAETVALARQRESHLALKDPTHDTDHAARNAHLQEDAVQSTPLFEGPLVYRLLLHDRLFDKLVGITGIRINNNMRCDDIRRIAETLHMSVRIDRYIKFLAHAKLEFHAILHGGIDLAQVIGVALVLVFDTDPPQRIEALEQMERPLAGADRINDNRKRLDAPHSLDCGLERVGPHFENRNFLPEFRYFFFLMASGKNGCKRHYNGEKSKFFENHRGNYHKTFYINLEKKRIPYHVYAHNKPRF